MVSWLMRRALRRGFGGEPLWLAVGAAAWLIHRAQQDRGSVLWRGTVRPGDRLTVRSWFPGGEPDVRSIVVEGAPESTGSERKPRRRGA